MALNDRATIFYKVANCLCKPYFPNYKMENHERSLPLPEDRSIKLSLEHISFIDFSFSNSKNYPKAKFAIKKAI